MQQRRRLAENWTKTHENKVETNFTKRINWYFRSVTHWTALELREKRTLTVKRSIVEYLINSNFGSAFLFLRSLASPSKNPKNMWATDVRRAQSREVIAKREPTQSHSWSLRRPLLWRAAAVGPRRERASVSSFATQLSARPPASGGHTVVLRQRKYSNLYFLSRLWCLPAFVRPTAQFLRFFFPSLFSPRATVTPSTRPTTTIHSYSWFHLVWFHFALAFKKKPNFD